MTLHRNRLLFGAGLALVIGGGALALGPWPAALLKISSRFGPGELRLAGWGILIQGGLCLALAHWVLPRWDQLTDLARRPAVARLAPLGLWLALALLIGSQAFVPGFDVNEVDVLPSARQFVQPGWLPNDWFLNLDLGYRAVFDRLLGSLIPAVGFQAAAYAGRWLGYLLVAAALLSLFRALRLPAAFGFLAVAGFLLHQTLGAGEWIVGGAETKTFAYALVIGALAAGLRRRPAVSFALAGAAVSFHVLVGGYALFALSVAHLALPAWRRGLWQAWPAGLTSVFGWPVVFQQLSPSGVSAADTARAWTLYVTYRNPHHLLPSAWHGPLWQIELALLSLGLLWVLITARAEPARFAAAFALGALLLFAAGLGLAAAGAVTWLRFYWFRLADVLAPLLGWCLAAWAFNEFLAGRLAEHSRLAGLRAGLLSLWEREVRAFLITGLGVVIGLAGWVWVSDAALTAAPAFTWIAAHTPADAVFLVNPASAEFYLYAQRAMFVSWKHTPQTPAEILEWYRRLTLCNDGRPPSGDGFAGLAHLSVNYDRLTEAQITAIAAQTRIDYVVTAPAQALAFERVYSGADYAVYKLPGAGQP